MKHDFIPTSQAPDFETLVMDLVEDGGRKRFGLPYSVIPLFRKDGSAGYAYFDGTRLVHTLEMKKDTAGKIDFEWIESRSGTVLHRRVFRIGGTEDWPPTSDSPGLEPACPMIDLLYRICFREYEKIPHGKADLRLIGLMEGIIGSIHRTRPGLLGFDRGRDPRAWRRLQDDLDRLNSSRIHSWKERFSSSRKMKADYRKIRQFKQRVHRSGSIRAKFLDGWLACLAAIRRFTRRPRENLVGVIDHLLLDPIRWFGGVVRSNMGYSIALAVYSPFTFFFITQPMNPHAMRAVEKVRNAGLSLIEPGKTVDPKVSNPGIVTEKTAEKEGETEWKLRMEHFKSMQIALESKLDYSKRIGRLEEVETQLAWPVTLEGAWDESTRYRQSLDYLVESAHDAPWRTLLEAEKRRLGEVRVYLRDRLLRFILDHRFLILDPGSELGQSVHSARSAITLYSRIHDTMLRENPSLPAPPESEKIIAIASRDPATDLPEPAFKREERARYWESLYLMQSRTQESSNSGLQAYWWSVRNTVSVLQMMMATRREEMLLLSLRPRPPARERTAFEDRYRSMLRLLDTEFQSIRPELATTLPGDREATLREGILTGVREYLAERERL